MSVAPVFRFLEDFGRLPPMGGVSAAGQEGLSEIGSPPEEGRADFVEPDPAEQLEQAVKAAYDDGYQAAREELEAGFEARINAAVDEARQAAESARAADIAALSATLESLFGSYDEFIDHLFESALRPVIADALKVDALEQFKERLIESANRKEMVVNLSGPAQLTQEAAAMLAPHGIEANIGEDRQGELTARFGDGMLRARLGRIDAFFGGLTKSEAEPRDD